MCVFFHWCSLQTDRQIVAKGGVAKGHVKILNRQSTFLLRTPVNTVTFPNTGHAFHASPPYMSIVQRHSIHYLHRRSFTHTTTPHNHHRSFSITGHVFHAVLPYMPVVPRHSTHYLHRHSFTHTTTILSRLLPIKKENVLITACSVLFFFPLASFAVTFMVKHDRVQLPPPPNTREHSNLPYYWAGISRHSSFHAHSPTPLPSITFPATHSFTPLRRTTATNSFPHVSQ